jgi:hypothetical protein
MIRLLKISLIHSNQILFWFNISSQEIQNHKMHFVTEWWPNMRIFISIFVSRSNNISKFFNSINFSWRRSKICWKKGKQTLPTIWNRFKLIQIHLSKRINRKATILKWNSCFHNSTNDSLNDRISSEIRKILSNVEKSEQIRN